MDDSTGMSGHWAPIAEKIRQYGEREREIEGETHTHTHTQTHTHNKTHKHRHGKMGQATLERRGHAVLAPAGFLP